MNLPPFSFTVLDTETTGFVPKTHRIIEFASMRSDGGKVVDEYEQLIYFKGEIPPHIEVLTRIKTKDLANQPEFEDVLEKIEEHIGADTMIVGQNIPYDLSMLKGEGIDLDSRPWIDTSMLASLVFPAMESYSLGYLSTSLQLDHTPVHRALGDVKATLQLLSKCWERLIEMPSEYLDQALEIMEKAPEGYRIFFEAVKAASEEAQTAIPAWMAADPERPPEKLQSHDGLSLAKPNAGTVELIEEPPAPGVLQEILNKAAADTGSVHWLAVKNLPATLKGLKLPADVRVLHPAFMMLDPGAKDALLTQESFTADEATLAIKLLWYKPVASNDFPLHGDERAVWNGKLAATEEADVYQDQLMDLPSVVLLDHRQLLQFLSDDDHEFFNERSHIIIDDASMLEDTGTKACGWHVTMDHLRAAAEGNADMTRLADLAALWIEKIRDGKDIHYLSKAQLSQPDVTALLEQIETVMDAGEVPLLTRQLLSNLRQIFDASNLGGRIVYSELRYDGALQLHSVPESIALFLKQRLYEHYSVSLLVPPRSQQMLEEIIPSNSSTSTEPALNDTVTPFEIAFPEDITLERLLSDPPEGKTIILAGSKRSIDDVYIKHAEDLEAAGIKLICQGLSGGANRMRAEFMAAEGTTLWFLTPWAYELMDMPSGTADRMIMMSLPFDHPSHAVFSKRAERYQNSFMDYSLVRLKHRLFRVLRTFSTHCKDGSEVLLLDARLHQKKYGQDVLKYLDTLANPPEGQ